MALWLVVTIFAHLLNAIVFILDKHLVSKTVMKPIVFAFYTGIFQIIYIALIPLFGIDLPEMKYLLLSIGIGALFTFTLVFFYRAMEAGESTRVVPIVGGLNPVFTLILAYIFLGERLEFNQLAALFLFILGGFLLSSKIDSEHLKIIKGIKLAVLSAFLFAAYYSLIKFLFLHVDFLGGFVAIQSGLFLGGVMLALPRRNREIIFSSGNAVGTIKKETLGIFVSDKILGGLAGALIPYAISLQGSSVSIINSLQAIQYVFLLALAVILSNKFPSFLKEQTDNKIIGQKILAIAIIGIGLYVLQLGSN